MNQQTYPIVSGSKPGRFFVDESCIYCELCVETAPSNFAYDSVGGFAYVTAQPANQEELNQTLEATEGCPIESIGDHENYRPNYMNESVRRRASYLDYVPLIRFALVVLMIFGAYLVYFQTAEFFKAHGSKSWSTTTGTLSVEIGEHRKTLSYQYSVDGVTYNSDRVIFGELGNRVRSKEWSAVGVSPDGSEITVYYNPNNPQESTLYTALMTGSWSNFLIGAVILLMGGIPMILLPKLKRIAE